MKHEYTTNIHHLHQTLPIIVHGNFKVSKFIEKFKNMSHNRVVTFIQMTRNTVYLETTKKDIDHHHQSFALHVAIVSQYLI